MKVISNSFIIIHFSLKVAAQKDIQITPLHKFFQTDADSTNMIGALETPQYYILSKKGDTISTYTYMQKTHVDKRLNTLPKVLGAHF